MNSLRLLGRAVPKPSSFRPLTSRCYSIASRSAARPSWQAAKRLTYPSFSTSIARKEPAGDGDQILAAKFESERSLEIDSVDPASDPPAIEDFKAKGVWEINERPGTNEIVLNRTLGNETIQIELNIMSMTDFIAEEEFDMDEEDGALADEDYEQPKRTINQSGAKGGPVDVVAEDSIAPADREAGFEDEANRTSYPIDLEITITKAENQKIAIHAQARDGTIEVHKVEYLPSTPADDDNTTAYGGPPFSNLDADLIVMFDQYLEERGVNAELANILPVLIEHKEQKEYVEWLQHMQKFIEA